MQLKEAKAWADRFPHESSAEKIGFLRGLRNHPHVDPLRDALASAVKSLIGERDALLEAVTNQHGEFTDPEDKQQVDEADGEINEYQAVLANAGHAEAEPPGGRACFSPGGFGDTPQRIVTVAKGEAGYRPTDLTAGTYERAWTICDRLNAAIGVSREQANEIIAQSMGLPAVDD